ncbi:unnamed protein product [Rangifer tarandus platyrhynchus]|uniref:Uncharacterized protein n=1 Tax=Rangifer tarandus platyrhynchus TaxID=3082113 RepID=A0AC59Z0M8_RANTA
MEAEGAAMFEGGWPTGEDNVKGIDWIFCGLLHLNPPEKENARDPDRGNWDTEAWRPNSGAGPRDPDAGRGCHGNALGRAAIGGASGAGPRRRSRESLASWFPVGAGQGGLLDCYSRVRCGSRSC